MRTVLLVLVLACTGAAQTTGVPGINDLRIDGFGSGATSCVATNLATPGVVTIEVDGSPGDPIVGVASQTCMPGALVLSPGKTVDLDVATVQFVFDGTGFFLPTGFLTPFFAVPSSGTFTLAPSLACPQGPLFAFQAFLITPAGACPTQAHDLACIANPCALATAANDVGAGNHTSHNVALTGAFPTFSYYGAGYTELWISSNGFVTFCAGDADFTPTPFEFLGSPSAASELPRIAPAWQNYNAPMAGSVHVAQSDTTVTVMWCGVPRFGPQCGGDSNTFSVELDKTNGDITFSYANMGNCNGASTAQIIVGLSPGFDAAGACPGAPNAPVTTAEQSLHPEIPIGVLPHDALWQQFFSGVEAWDFPNPHAEVFIPVAGPTYANTTP